MKTFFQSSIMILLVGVGTFAQQPAQPGFQTRLQSVVAQNGAPSTRNYQVELAIQRGEKVARYRMTLNGGSVSTELMDRFAERVEGAAPFTINFNATLHPFEEGNGAEAIVFLGRSMVFKTKSQSPSGAEREVLTSKSIPLTTKVALLTNKPVTIFEDEEERISLKLTELPIEGDKQ